MKYKVRLKSSKGTVIEAKGYFVNGRNSRRITFPEFQAKEAITHFSLVDPDNNEFTSPLDQALYAGPFYTVMFDKGKVTIR